MCHVRLIRPCCVSVRFFLLTGWFMTHQVDVARSRDVVARWCALAEQRLEYLTELFETGRWRLFHTERAFLENLREAKVAVETWRDLSVREASLNNSAIDMSWLGHTTAGLPRGEARRDQAHQPPLAEIQSEPPPSMISIVPENGLAGSDEGLSGSAIGDIAELVSEVMPIARRYPVLHNAL
jgi:uncharacterized repeat protein (TIGR03809 family)